MLTIVTTPRPLRSGKFRMDLYNAVGSWLRLKPTPQILVFGGEVPSVAREGVTHIPEFPQNAQGLPYLDGCLSIAQEMAENGLLMLTSDHLILRSDFMVALKRLAAIHGSLEGVLDTFAAVGQRWDRFIDMPIDFDDLYWETEILQHGEPRGGSAKDYFIFSTPLPFEVKNFVLGRRRWDSWFLHQLCISMPVVDISCAAIPVHPVHGYGHVPLGEKAGDGLTTDPGTLHNMAIEVDTPTPNRIDDLTWGLTCEQLLSGDDWHRWKNHNLVQNKHKYPQRARKMKRPLYCWDIILEE